MTDRPQVANYDCATGEATDRDMTDEELVVHNDRLAQAEEDNAARLVAEAQERADANAGRQKLLDLGLSEEEVTALVGAAPVEPEAAPAI